MGIDDKVIQEIVQRILTVAKPDKIIPAKSAMRSCRCFHWNRMNRDRGLMDSRFPLWRKGKLKPSVSMIV